MGFLKRRIFQTLGTFLPNSYLQGFSLSIANGALKISPSLYQGSLKSVCSPLLNCYACPSALFSCPIGTLQHFMEIGRAHV